MSTIDGESDDGNGNIGEPRQPRHLRQQQPRGLLGQQPGSDGDNDDDASTMPPKATTEAIGPIVMLAIATTTTMAIAKLATRQRHENMVMPTRWRKQRASLASTATFATSSAQVFLAGLPRAMATT